jgi:hypothetical protein
LSSLSYFNDHKIRSLITTVNPKKIFGVRRRCRRPSPLSSTVAAVAVDSLMRGVDDSPYRRVGESAI